MSEETYCARHPKTATNLRCSRCDALVCPGCMVHSAVGIRCPDCGKATTMPIYDVSTPLLVRAILASLLLGVGGGLVFALLVRPELLFRIASPLMYVAAMAGFGYLVAEGVSRAANKKRGRTLQYVAAGGMALALVLVSATAITFGPLIGFSDLLAAGAGVYVAILRMR